MNKTILTVDDSATARQMVAFTPVSYTHLSEGDVSVKPNALSEQDALGQALIRMVQNLNALVRDAQELSATALKGDLSKRADVGKHQGEYRRVMEGMNDTLEAIAGPLHTAGGRLAQIAKGEIPPKISDHYQGEFDALKLNVNQSIDTLKSCLLYTSRCV